MSVSQVDKNNSNSIINHQGETGDKASMAGRLRPHRAASQIQPTGYLHVPHKPLGQVSSANIPSSVFGKQKKGWSDHVADAETLQSMHSMTSPAMVSRPIPPYVLANASGMKPSKAPSISEQAANQVKFVNSTVENLQNQIKKEEAPKKKRTRTSPEQLRILHKAFATDPMPSSQARMALSKKLGMNARAVQVWFQNRRAKAKRAESLGLSASGLDDDHDISGGGSDDDGEMHEPKKNMQKGMNSRAASMSSMAMSYNGGHADPNAYFNMPNQNFFDATSFMDPHENGNFEAEMMLPGLDFYSGVNYNSAPSYGMSIMQDMFSLTPNSFDMNNNTSMMQDPLVMRGYGFNAHHYPSFTDETNLNEDLLSQFNNELGVINPLSAIVDNHVNAEGRYHASTTDNAHNMHHITHPNRRSYSLNDIHSQLTSQQIHTLENIMLPEVGHGGKLGSIKEEEPSLLATAPEGHHQRTDAGNGYITSTNDDQLLSTIDDLRMGSFWDSTAPEH